jgi:hypothetical protein
MIDPTKFVYDQICNHCWVWLYSRRVCRYASEERAEVLLYDVYKNKLNGEVESKYIDWPRLIKLIQKE